MLCIKIHWNLIFISGCREISFHGHKLYKIHYTHNLSINSVLQFLFCFFVIKIYYGCSGFPKHYYIRLNKKKELATKLSQKRRESVAKKILFNRIKIHHNVDNRIITIKFTISIFFSIRSCSMSVARDRSCTTFFIWKIIARFTKEYVGTSVFK